jgi:hypothetical protein
LKKKLVVSMLFATSIAAWSQTRLDLRTQTKNVDFSGALSTRPVKVGTAIPSACTAGELYFKSDAPAGANLFGCTATNTWTVMSSTTSGGTATSGPYYCADAGTVNAFSCSGITQVTVYATGQLILLRAASTNTGAATLNVNGLGGKAIRKSGNLALAANEVVAGQVVTLVYDGTVFQVQALGIAGPQGPQGPAGATGATGATGPAGPAIGGLLTTKGDSVSHDGAAAIRLAGCPDGQIRIADSTQSGGWRCDTPPASGSGSGALFCVGAGINAYSCNVGTATQYDLGMTLAFQAGSGNTGPTTFNLNGIGAKSVLKFRDQLLESGDIRAGQIVTIAYDGSSFQMQSERGTYVAPGPTLALKQDKTVFPNTIDIDTNLICLKTGVCAPIGAFDLSGSSKTAPFRIGATDPATCDASVREFFYNTTAGSVKVCNTTNTWSAVGGGASGANADGYYLVSRAANAPTNAVNLGALGSGILRLGVSGGVATPAIATGAQIAEAFSGTGDYLKKDGTSGTPSGGASQITLLHQTLAPSDFTGTGQATAVTFATYTMPAGTLVAGDVVRVEAFTKRITGAGSPAHPKVSMADGSVFQYGYPVDGGAIYNVEWRITGSTAAVGTGVLQRITPVYITDGDQIVAPTTFGVASNNVVRLHCSANQGIDTGDVYRLVYFRVYRIRQ